MFADLNFSDLRLYQKRIDAAINNICAIQRFHIKIRCIRIQF